MKYYRLEDYHGQLPNSKTFLVKHSIIIAIENHPKMFSDGFMLDIAVREKDISKLQRHTSRTTNYAPIEQLIAKANECKFLLSEPKYVLEYDTISYGMTHSTEVKFIQAKYYRYFKNRYPKCQFLTSDDMQQSIAVKQSEFLVGLVMPVLSKNTVEEVEKEL